MLPDLGAECRIMALIEKNREPTSRELMIFGLLLAPFFGLIGMLVRWRTGSWTAPTALSVAGLLLVIVYLNTASVRRPVYATWMALLYPVGWAASHLLLALVYFGWVTPIGLLMRLFGYDPMRRRLGRERASNWVKRKPTENVNRYFRQY